MFRLFGGSYFYPLGGMLDYEGQYFTLAEALEAAEKKLGALMVMKPSWEGEWDWAHVYDDFAKKMVWHSDPHEKVERNGPQFRKVVVTMWYNVAKQAPYKDRVQAARKTMYMLKRQGWRRGE